MRELRRLLLAYPALLRVGLQEAIAYRAEFIVWMLSMTMPLVAITLDHGSWLAGKRWPGGVQGVSVP